MIATSDRVPCADALATGGGSRLPLLVAPPPHQILYHIFTHCPQAHSLEPSNVWAWRGNLHCKLCHLESAKRYRARRRGEWVPLLPKGPRRGEIHATVRASKPR